MKRTLSTLLGSLWTWVYLVPLYFACRAGLKAPPGSDVFWFGVIFAAVWIGLPCLLLVVALVYNLLRILAESWALMFSDGK